jgi:hypothetical protein
MPVVGVGGVEVVEEELLPPPHPKISARGNTKQPRHHCFHGIDSSESLARIVDPE